MASAKKEAEKEAEKKTAKRDPSRCYVHGVGWKEVAAHAKEFMDEKDLESFDTDEPDLSWVIEPINEKSALVPLVDELLKKRWSQKDAVQPLRGDVIQLKFISYRDRGVLFYDGKNVILPHEGEEYNGVPSSMKVPQFPPEYWSGVCLMAEDGPICFDVADLKELPAAKNVDLKDEIALGVDELKVCKIVAHGKEWMVFLSSADGTAFLKTGRCFPFSYLVDDVCPEPLVAALGATPANSLFIG